MFNICRSSQQNDVRVYILAHRYVSSRGRANSVGFVQKKHLVKIADEHHICRLIILYFPGSKLTLKGNYLEENFPGEFIFGVSSVGSFPWLFKSRVFTYKQRVNFKVQLRLKILKKKHLDLII